MKLYVRVNDGSIAEQFSTDGDITEMFNPALVWVDVTGVAPQPQVGWQASNNGGVWSFTAVEAPAAPTLDQVKATLCDQVDSAADAVYVEIGGPSPGRMAEYQQANTDAAAFKAAGYAGNAPPTVACWAEANAGWTNQQAADDIIATAARWTAALQAIRSARLLGKASINAATTTDAAEAAAATAISNVQAAGEAA
jgi:hypothetical protein